MPSDPLDRACHLADALLILLMVAAAFLLGCQQLRDADVWWHVRSGQWIWSHGRVPALDPFTFTSGDRPWIDLHWLFQLILAGSYAFRGVPGIILLASSLGGCAILVGLTSRERRWPMWMIVPGWLPVLVGMSDRYNPRPELLSLLAMAVYLAVLKRADRAPALAWVLLPVQVLWVNVHALFIFGPILMGAYLVDHLAGSIGRSRSATARGSGLRRSWIHLGGVTAAVGLACLINPYSLRGALFPLELLPKITFSDNIYKSNVIEFISTREFVRQGGSDATGSGYFRAECFLLWVLPLSFIVPAIWREIRPVEGRAREVHSGRAMTGLGAFGLAVVLILACVLGLPGQGTPAGMIWIGRLAPIGLVALGAVVMAFLAKSARQAGLLAALGGLVVASWVVCLRAYLLGPEPGPAAWLGMPGPGSFVVGWGTALLGVAVAGLTLRAGGRLFEMVLATVFGFLSLMAIRNTSMFGLVAGFVLAWNLGEWAGELAAQVWVRWPRRAALAGLAARIALGVLVGFIIFTTVSGQFFRAPREHRGFGLGESPLLYAHEAARFAGQPGLPERALVFGLRQAAVYMFHNGPERKHFMDGRLEVASRETFATYVWLEKALDQGRQGWAQPLRRMGDPLILLDHENESGAEGTLMTDPGWRCVYYDAVASVFVSRNRRDLEAPYPSVDFAARHFQDSQRQAVLPVPWGLAEASALLNLASSVESHGIIKPLHYSLMLMAFNRLQQAIALEPTVTGHWTTLGIACWNMVPDPMAPPLGPNEPWDLARGLWPAQATFCFRRAIELDPGEIRALSSLSVTLETRGMNDAKGTVASLLDRAQAAAGVTDTDRAKSGDRGKVALNAGSSDARKAPVPVNPEDKPLLRWEGPDGLARAIAGLLAQGRPEAAVQLFATAENQGVVPSWPTCDSVAVAFLHLGRPADARQIWERAANPPSQSLRLTRLATVALASLDFLVAEQLYRAALQLDDGLGEAWLGLALLYTERGDARASLDAARAALRRPMTPPQKALMLDIEALVAPYAAAR